MVRLIRSGILVAALALGVALSGAAQQKGPPGAPKDQMFSGIVTAMAESSLTAIRTTGQKDSKTFALTSATRFEGKPLVNSRVTIRYVTTEDGDHAIVVIVRAPAKK
jgi:hypothetical protein